MNIAEEKIKRPLISLTPLIDVVFILLVFFMLASSFTKWKFIELSVGEAESIPMDFAKQSLIRIDFDQRYQLNGQSMEIESIAEKVREQVRHKLDHPILIQPVNDLPLQQLTVVLDSIGEIAGPNISLVKDE
ncbi:MAG: ExbD/TolR family protein [Cellvibrionaceae bacterium]